MSRIEVSNTVSVIDTATNTVVATIPVGHGPDGVAVTPDGTHAYVANAGGQQCLGDRHGHQHGGGHDPGGEFPDGVAVTPDGKHAYVTNGSSDNTVSVIDTASNTVVATVPVGNGPMGVAVTPDGKHAYVANDQAPTPFRSSTRPPTRWWPRFRWGLSPIGVAVTPDGKHAYVANVISQHCLGDRHGHQHGGGHGPGGGTPGVAVTPDGKHAYVTNAASNTVSVIDTATNTVVATFGAGTDAIAVGIVSAPGGTAPAAENNVGWVWGNQPNATSAYTPDSWR